MVMGLALCTTFAFAQTSQRISPVSAKAVMSQMKAQKVSVDYKASIFTKTADTLHRFNFDSACAASMVYGSAAVLTATDVVDGQAIGDGAHAQTGNNAIYWQRIPDSAYMYSEQFRQRYPRLDQYGFLSANADYYGREINMGEDNGFMVMSLIDATQQAGNINAYMEFPAIALPENATVIDINFTQLYYRWNADQCYIDWYDYSSNGWKSRHINVRGVDITGSNYWGPVKPSYTMPLEITDNDSIKIRVRWACGPTANYYGIFWSVDNLCIVQGDATRLQNFNQTFVDGFYGTMPLEMRIPLSWYAPVANTGSETVSTAKISMLHLYNPDDTIDNNPEEFISVNQPTYAAGNPTATFYATINERHFLDSLGHDNLWTDGAGTWGFNNFYGTLNVPTNYIGLPVDEEGEHRIQTLLTAEGIDTQYWSAYSYNVVDVTGDESSVNLPVPGYRWSHDNGIIPSNSSFHVGYTVNGESLLVGDSGSYGSTGYWVAVRYTTGSEMPESDQPWSLLGIEIVPSTDMLDLNQNAMNNAKISPIVFKAGFRSNGNGFLNALDNVETGFSNSASYTVNTATSTNLTDGYGVIPSGAEYQAVNIKLPNMPVLEPNTSYYIGYRIDEPSRFSAAMTKSTYRVQNGQGRDTTAYYSETPGISRFSRQFGPTGFDVFVHDPDGGNYTAYDLADGGFLSGFPMIRAIVGPREDVPDVHVIARCNPEGLDSMLYYVMDGNQDGICDNNGITLAEGASTYVYIIPNDTMHYMIDSIIINGQSFKPENQNEWPENVTVEDHGYHVMNPADTNEVALFRAYYVVNLDNIEGDIVISAKAHWEPWHIGIDPVAPNVAVGVQPNPATSQVKINVAGVTGMVNCSIIDMSGRVVYNRDINAEESHFVDLNSFARGAYFVRITNDTFSKIEKLIVR